MYANQLRPASEICKVYGVKILAYGAPGTGKTPLVLTAPNPVLCATEPGMLSIRHSNIPVWEAPTFAQAKEFVDWAIASNEARQFHTFCFDSVSQLAETALEEEKPRHKDGRAAYGAMADKVFKLLFNLYCARNMHVYLIAKEGSFDGKFKAFFPGQDLNVRVPHLYDEVLRVQYVNINGKQERAFRTRDDYTCVARDRIGKLAELEPANLGYIIQKCLT